MKVFVSGATGFIGQALVSALLARGDTLVVLTRDQQKAASLWPSQVQIVEADPAYEGAWQAYLAGCDAVIHLAGQKLTSERWTARFRQQIHDSRVDSTRFIAEGICKLNAEQRPKVLLNASGVDYYGFAEVELFDEDEIDEASTGGESFLAGLCWDWEDETTICKEAGVRVALMRTGLVLGKGCEALVGLQGPMRFGIGRRLGPGTQWMSWIHIEDVVGAYLFALDNELTGAINLAAPGNVRNAEFCHELANSLGGHAWFPVPAILLNRVLGQLAEYVIKGRRVVPAVLTAAGYKFRYGQLDDALNSLR